MAFRLTADFIAERRQKVAERPARKRTDGRTV
jgi:hypothetical protein